MICYLSYDTIHFFSDRFCHKVWDKTVTYCALFFKKKNSISSTYQQNQTIFLWKENYSQL